MTKRRDFLKKAGVATAAAVGAAALPAPYVRAQTPIKWRLQTYAGPALAEHVIKPSIDAFNKVANGEMVIELYTSDQLVPTRAEMTAPLAWHEEQLARPRRFGELEGGGVGYEDVSHLRGGVAVKRSK